MTVHEIAASLPHGFHDAFLIGVEVDYARRVASLRFEVWVGAVEGESEGESEGGREDYQAGILRLSGVAWFCLNTPDQDWLEPSTNGPSVDLVPSERTLSLGLWPAESVPSGAFPATFGFSQQWNAFVTVAALDAAWEWLTGPRRIY